MIDTNMLIFDTIIAFFAFAITRYTLPNYILGKDLSVWHCMIYSLCYALCACLRKYMSLKFKEKNFII